MIPGRFIIDDVFSGCDWSNSFEFYEDDGVTPLNLTGYTFEVEFSAGSVTVDLTSGSGLTVVASPASVAVRLTAAQIATLGGAGTLAEFALFWTVSGSKYKVLVAQVAIGRGPRT